MSELVDLVNEHGEVVKRGVERDDAKNYNGLYMQIVIVVITNAAGLVLAHERAKLKPVNGGDIDHVCGGIQSGEKPEAAASREAYEEVTLDLDTLVLIQEGLNSYNRYCRLFKATASGEPTPDPKEAEWAAFYPEETLRSWYTNAERTFVDGFIEDMEIALAS